LRLLPFRLKAAQVACDKRGVTALEYAMIAALIALVIVGAVTTLGTRVNTTFGNVATRMGRVAAK
jgi:pilus assembly protein Flp/PilA